MCGSVIVRITREIRIQESQSEDELKRELDNSNDKKLCMRFVHGFRL